MAKSRQSYLENKSPSHHQFGISELIETGQYQADYMLVAPSKKVKSRVLKMLSLIPVWIKAYIKARKYDIVYGAADFTVDFMGMMKKLGLFRPTLITIFHHPPFNLRFKLAKYDKVLFLSEFSCNEMKRDFPKKSHLFEFMQWGPDLQFYKKYAAKPNYENIGNELVFISNGKTHRDHEILVNAAENAECKTIVVCDEASVPANYDKNKCSYTEMYFQNKPDDTKMVQLLTSCSVLVVPTFPSEHRLGPIGLTSFVDVMAMGMPIITADNTVFTHIVTENNVGLVYKAGDVDDLCDKMRFFKENPEMVVVYGRNAYEFGQKNDAGKFACRLQEILNETDKK